jgi:hypothetical protein
MLLRCLLILFEVLFFGSLFTMLFFTVKSFIDRKFGVKALKEWKDTHTELQKPVDALLARSDTDWDLVTKLQDNVRAHELSKPKVPKWMFWVK